MAKDSSSFDANRNYDDKSYNITGGALNDIGQEILNLRAQLEKVEKDAMHHELNDLRLRDKNPALKDAWDKYQTVLGLSRKT